MNFQFVILTRNKMQFYFQSALSVHIGNCLQLSDNESI